MSFASAPNRLVVRDIELTEPGAKLVISKDRKVNVAQIVRKQPGGDSPSGEAKAANRADGEDGDQTRASAPTDTSRPAAQAGPPALDARIERLHLHGGTVDYADLSLVLPFSTRVTSVEGTVVGLATTPGRRAEVQADGEIPPYGSASVEGSLLPTAPTEFLDLRVVFENVAIPPLSPYTATFAGRTVESGKLWLDLDYKIDNTELLGENKIRLADFKLGERVEASGAMDLPLDLAVALLTDDEGRIDLAVPVRGDVDNPSFDVGTLVREAIGNLLKRIVTAPFRALGNLFGGKDGGEQTARIEFDAGSAALTSQDRERLDQIAQVLAKRPQLKLVVAGPYAPQRDAEALRTQAARAALAAAMGRPVVPGDEPGPIDYGDPRTQRELAQLLDRQAGAGSAQALLAADGGATGGKSKDATAPYRRMFEKLAAQQELSDAALQQLGAQRAQAVVAHLVKSGASAERVQTGRIESVETDEGEPVATTLELGVMSRES